MQSCNLASHILARVSKVLAHQWYERYRIYPVLLESFVECERFRGTCYSKPLLDHLASELAKEYVRLIKQSATEEQNTINTENNSCVLEFTPATAQKASVKRA